MKERPIIFSSEMVRALLDGRKTMTRRIVKPQPLFLDSDNFGDCWFPSKDHPKALHYASEKHFRRGLPQDFCLYGIPGDRLWVRETWGSAFDKNGNGIVVYKSDGSALLAQAEQEGEGDWCGVDGQCPKNRITMPSRWRSPLHMPRWASRLTLEITDVRVQRLQEITEEDALAEGAMEWWNGLSERERVAIYEGGRGPAHAFKLLWNYIHGPYAWALNSWVWAISFKLIQSKARAE